MACTIDAWEVKRLQKSPILFKCVNRLARDSNSTYTIDKDELADIQRAIRLVRSRATEWGIDTAKIGVMGFSAGGEVAALSAMRFDNGNTGAADPIDRLNCRPAFQALVYPGGTGRYENAATIDRCSGRLDRPVL